MEKAQPNPDWNSSAEVLRRLCIPNALHQHVPNKPADYYTCAFRRSKLDKFLGSDSRDSYFSNTQRHRIVSRVGGAWGPQGPAPLPALLCPGP
ncbi:anoctamin-7-like [Mauremys reevesii]|uniref:anoctamin-7-like n=1 Tax=Mauremys reevesii TaxID=260615 RepID=UPI00193F1FEB|nr:anoctamin-7-like [Mauremys reevesii]